MPSHGLRFGALESIARVGQEEGLVMPQRPRSNFPVSRDLVRLQPAAFLKMQPERSQIRAQGTSTAGSLLPRGFKRFPHYVYLSNRRLGFVLSHLLSNNCHCKSSLSKFTWAAELRPCRLLTNAWYTVPQPTSIACLVCDCDLVPTQ